MGQHEHDSREQIALDEESRRRAFDIVDDEEGAALNASDEHFEHDPPHAQDAAGTPDEAISQTRHEGPSDGGVSARPGVAAHRSANRTPYCPGAVRGPRGPRR